MKQLVIIGTGGFAREVYTLALETKDFALNYTIKGFIANDSLESKNIAHYPSYLGSVEDYIIEEDDVFIIAIANPIIKRKCFEDLGVDLDRYINIVHPTAVLCQGVSLGNGVIIGRQVIISNDSEIENFVTFNSRVMIGHDTKINVFTHLNAGVFVGGEVFIKNDCILHTMALISPRLTVSEGSTVGIGSVVIKDVAAYTTVFGNPAREIFKSNIIDN